MKRYFLTIFLILTTINFGVYADETYQINLEHVLNHGTHFEFPVPADKPNLYLDTDDMEIIVDGLGVVDSYDVDIEAVSTGYVLISTEVDGDYDTIDISSLPGDQYMITVTTPYNNTYVGYFYVK